MPLLELHKKKKKTATLARDSLVVDTAAYSTSSNILYIYMLLISKPLIFISCAPPIDQFR